MRCRLVGAGPWATLTERALSVDDGMFLGLAGYTPDGSSLLVVEALSGQTSGSVHWFDPASLRPVRSREQAHDGSIRAMDLADGGTRLATASADGVVRVWDVATGDLVHEIPFPDGIRGVAFVDDVHLAVVPNDGDVMMSPLTSTSWWRSSRRHSHESSGRPSASGSTSATAAPRSPTCAE